ELVVTLACDGAINAVGDALRNQLLALGGHLVVGTPDTTPCRGYDSTGDGWVNYLGTQAEPCFWDATFELNEGGFTPDTSWVGVRATDTSGQ
ncbi:MAG: hypothetical protein VX938_11140, partial [Myxococcota bacterium]|nr:hypothetical protein [Myxococcota bacterium]